MIMFSEQVAPKNLYFQRYKNVAEIRRVGPAVKQLLASTRSLTSCQCEKPKVCISDNLQKFWAKIHSETD